ncbi:hypothetical protein NST18_03600 [Anoxybacillus sp. FSL W8-0104]|uniref:hypothetical protein n=1 Tax=Anoxybacillus sp. FSL W8-0104 TaxID=2954594 RepID=UPI0030F99EE8
MNEFFPTQKNETVKVVAKKVENEYMKMAERAKREAEQKRKREIIDISAIVVEDWELDEKKREDEQKEKQDHQERQSKLNVWLNELD